MAAVVQYIKKNRGIIADFACCTALTYGSAWYFNKSMRTVLAIHVAFGAAYYIHNQYVSRLFKSLCKNDFNKVIKQYARIDATKTDVSIFDDFYLSLTIASKKYNESSFGKDAKLNAAECNQSYIDKRSPSALSRMLCTFSVVYSNLYIDDKVIYKIFGASFAELSLGILINTLSAIQFANLANVSRYNYTCTTSFSSCILASLNFASTYFAAHYSALSAYDILVKSVSADGYKEYPITLNALRLCAFLICDTVLRRLVANSDYYLLGTSFNSPTANIVKLIVAPRISGLIIDKACSLFTAKPEEQAHLN